MDKDENLKIVYNEVTELHNHQQQGFDLMFNKLNWILVSDFVFMAGLYSFDCVNIFVVLLISLSATLALIGFSPLKFNSTAKISDQLDKISEPNFLKSLISKKREAFNANITRGKKVEEFLKVSQWLLILAMAFQFLTII